MIKEHIEGFCRFQFYKDGSLWYITAYTNFLFPVPISDIGNATFNASEKGLLMMRYIRKHMKTLEEKV